MGVLDLALDIGIAENQNTLFIACLIWWKTQLLKLRHNLSTYGSEVCTRMLKIAFILQRIDLQAR
jgi:hypothetical protein